MQDEKVTFKVFKATPQPSNVENCFKIDTKDKQVVEVPKEGGAQKLLSKESNQPKSTKSKNVKIEKQSFYLKATPPNEIWKKVQKIAKNLSRLTPFIHEKHEDQ